MMGIKYIYLELNSMHMKLSRLSSDMYTACKISVYIYVHGILACMHAVYSALCEAIKE